MRASCSSALRHCMYPSSVDVLRRIRPIGRRVERAGLRRDVRHTQPLPVLDQARHAGFAALATFGHRIHDVDVAEAGRNLDPVLFEVRTILSAACQSGANGSKRTSANVYSVSTPVKPCSAIRRTASANGSAV